MNKNGFLTFLFSIIPGCGLMYLGYMKKGLQVMAMFAAAAFIGAFFENYNIDWIGGLFLLLLPVIWFYQMFDSMHTVSRMKNQGITLPADDGFYLPDGMVHFSAAQNRTFAKILAGILILVGSFTLIMGILNNLWRFPGLDRETLEYISIAIRHNLIPAIVSIILIIAGVRLLKGGKSEKTQIVPDKDGDPS